MLTRAGMTTDQRIFQCPSAMSDSWRAFVPCVQQAILAREGPASRELFLNRTWNVRRVARKPKKNLPWCLNNFKELRRVLNTTYVIHWCCPCLCMLTWQHAYWALEKSSVVRNRSLKFAAANSPCKFAANLQGSPEGWKWGANYGKFAVCTCHIKVYFFLEYLYELRPLNSSERWWIQDGSRYKGKNSGG
jgi:hypothetical protein